MADTIAGRFTLIDHIGGGGSGTIWRAWDAKVGRICAAKVLRQRDSADLLRFIREQGVKLDHPYLLTPYGWSAEDEHVVIAMELMSGGTLGSALSDHGAFSEPLAAEILLQLLNGLTHVHGSGWVHRDVKLSNILLEATGCGRPHIRLADFGIAFHAADPRLTHFGGITGTPGYLAPEVLQLAEPAAAQDLYAAGVVGLLMVKPWLDSGTTDVRSEAGSLDSAYGAVVQGLLSARPAERQAAAEQAPSLLAGQLREEGYAAATDEVFEVFDVLGPLPEGWQPKAAAARANEAAASPGTPAQRPARLNRPWAEAAAWAGVVSGALAVAAAVAWGLAGSSPAAEGDPGQGPETEGTHGAGLPEIPGPEGTSVPSGRDEPPESLVPADPGAACSWVEEGSETAGGSGAVLRCVRDGLDYRWTSS